MKVYRLAVSVISLFAFALFAAPAAHAVCYADSSREAGSYVQQTEPDEETQREIYILQQAFAAGLQTVDAHTYTDSLTEQDKEILKLLDETIPGIINKIQKSSSEIEEELNSASETLARKIIANQNLYPAPKNWEMATSFAAMTAMMHAIMTGAINEQAAQVLMNESMNMLQEMMPAME